MSTPTQMPPENTFLGETPGDDGAIGTGDTVNQAPPSRLILAIVAIIFFIPLGIVALVNSLKVNRLVAAGDTSGAVQASRNARLFSLWAIVVGGISAVITAVVVVGLVMASQLVGGALVDPDEPALGDNPGGTAPNATVTYTLTASSEASAGVQVVVNNDTIVDEKFTGAWDKTVSVEPGSTLEFWVFDDDAENLMTCSILDADKAEVSAKTEATADANAVQCVVPAQ